MINHSLEMKNWLISNAKDYTMKELVVIVKDMFNETFTTKQLATYCLKKKIKYKFEKPKKSHSNTPTKIGTIVNKTDGDMLKIKVGNHKWKYLQRDIYEKYYGIKLPENVYVIFLDQNKRNFDIKNLKAISRQESAIMSKDNLFGYNAKTTKLGKLASDLKIKAKIIERNKTI